MANGNEAVVRRLVEEVLNRGDTALLDVLVAADHVGHDPLGDHYGPEGMRIAVAEYRAAFPDLRASVDDLVAVRNKVVRRFTFRGTHAGPFLGIPPTGRPVAETGIAIDRLVAGRVAESWVSVDLLGLLRQIGATPVVRRPADPKPLTPPADSGAARE